MVMIATLIKLIFKPYIQATGYIQFNLVKTLHENTMVSVILAHQYPFEYRSAKNPMET